MPLTPKDEIEESSSASEPVPAELKERLSEVEALVSEHDSTIGGLGETSGDHAAELKELRERVGHQEAVIHELIETVEALAAGMDANDAAKGFTKAEEEGSDAYPFRWETETLDFKAQKYE